MNPDAAVFIRFHVDAPIWWNRMHPEECVKYANIETKEYPEEWSLVRHTTLKKDLQDTKVHSLASLLWRKEATEIIVKMLHMLAQMLRKEIRSQDFISATGYPTNGITGDLSPMNRISVNP